MAQPLISLGNAVSLHKLLDKMKRDWDERARINPRYYIADCREDWSEEEFFDSGEQTVAQFILNDMINVCQGRQPEEMRVLELGCGAARVTRALANVFGEVHGVDVSGEMLDLARRATAGLANVRVYQNNGRDLGVLGSLMFDFAFSSCVFHHVPSKVLVESCIREVGAHLKPGSLFKFEVQGCLDVRTSEHDTWLGTPMSELEMLQIAERCGFDPRYRVGAGEERFWLWFFRKP
jgi:SAM-dependent methyltransferase